MTLLERFEEKLRINYMVVGGIADGYKNSHDWMFIKSLIEVIEETDSKDSKI